MKKQVNSNNPEQSIKTTLIQEKDKAVTVSSPRKLNFFDGESSSGMVVSVLSRPRYAM